MPEGRAGAAVPDPGPAQVAPVRKVAAVLDPGPAVPAGPDSSAGPLRHDQPDSWNLAARC
jgi:hypothetical protein